MSAYSPTLGRTTEMHGLDRLLVRLGTNLTTLGHRRAAARSAVLASGRERPHASRATRGVWSQHLERERDNSAQHHPLLLR
ncbi:hypothetical protein [Cellulosimicrobium arenosum]|uniref:Uncharacterized protein n=1 Tax=Cellulosimicrobium arenosum TaxID=2708133 RepID=A0A927J1U2_9MICO|nr:hypothetical protein [Cellulosimicrobium arenosum]MBD8080277.1 hypothetical protein [Cellulosimicrobium arenosum]